MASAPAVSAIIRSARPTFRNKADKVAFAVHAYFMCTGYKLVALGDAADLAAASKDAPEVPIDNWNADEDQYSFLYVPEHTSEPALLVRALVAGDLLLASVLPGTATAEPVTVELAVERFAGPDASSYSYQELGALLGSLRAALPQAAPARGPSSSHKASTTSTTASQPPAQQQPQHEPDMYHDPLMIGPPRRGGMGAMPGYGGPGMGMPGMGVGGGDLEPPGMGPGLGGPFEPGLGGGGMQVGPDHPMFAGGMRHPGIRPGLGGAPPGLPPGARWDPIRPEGLQGWRPDDFQRGRGRGGGTHPDIMPPGPGRGTDWDNMFG